MCGIFGLVSTNKNNKGYDLQNMLQVLHHRGPDEKNLYSLQVYFQTLVLLTISSLGTADFFYSGNSWLQDLQILYL